MVQSKIPQKGLFSVSLACIGEYQLIETGPCLSASIYHYTIIALSENNSQGIFHDMVGKGIGMGPIGGPEGDDIIHYATYEDQEGDRIYEWFEGRFTGHASGKGTLTLFGGTGKYQDIRGMGEQHFTGLNYNYHDPENPNPTGPVQLKAQKTGKYRL